MNSIKGLAQSSAANSARSPLLAMTAAGLMMGLAFSSHASDSPSLVDERQPTQVPGLEQMREASERRSAAQVSLPRVVGAISRETEVPVSHLDFRGGTVFELDDLASGMSPMLGQRVTVGELIDAVEAITRRYQESGYPLSYAYLPDNYFRNGVVTVVAVEGYIARTEIAIDKASVASRVQRLAERYRAGLDYPLHLSRQFSWYVGGQVDHHHQRSLLSPEQGNYGGNRFGRGYGDSQAEGDYGVAGEIELRYLQPVASDWLGSVDPYLLVDGARTRFNERDAGHEIASAVAGVELSQGRLYRLGIEYAQPIGDRDLDTDSRDARINARIS